MAKLVSKTYGDALFDVALEDGCMDELLEDAELVIRAFEDNEDLGRLLNNPKIEKGEKEKVIADIFGQYVSKSMSGLLELMVSKQRHNEITGTLEYFNDRVREYKNIGRAWVTTAVPLSDEQKSEVVSRLLKTTKYVEFEMNYNIDKSVIGGMVIRIGDRVFDSSIKSQLDSLTRQLKKIQLSE